MPNAHVGVNKIAVSAISAGVVKYEDRYRNAMNAMRLLNAYQKMEIEMKFDGSSGASVSPGQLNMEQWALFPFQQAE